MISVRWEQHPVGHGGFHTGFMSSSEASRVQWIYDCGAKQTAKFDAYLRRWLDENLHPIDWLFVSHFDTDHVSGLDTLLAGAVVKDVMVPYLNDREFVLQLLFEAGRGTLDRKLVELGADPAAYFLSRGAERVTFVGGGDADRAEDTFGPEPSPERGRGWKTMCHPAPRAVRPTSGVRNRPQGVAGVQVIESGSDLSITREGEGIRFKPYRAPISPVLQDGLVASLEDLVGATARKAATPGLGELAYAVANHARTRSGRVSLRNLFKNHAGSSNRSSMSLLSIPISDEPDWRHWHIEHGSRFDVGGGEPAWLNTGDAELYSADDLDDWEDCYASDLTAVRVLALPHHGSDRNSDGALQVLCPNATLTAHVKADGKKHPGINVATAAGGRLTCVTEQAATRVRMYFG